MASAKYSWRHQKIREAMIAEALANGARCHFCARPLLPGQLLDLDHTADGTGYRGVAHRHCNRADGARRGNAIRRWKRQRRSTIFPPTGGVA